MYTDTEILSKLDELLQLKSETEVVEFKHAANKFPIEDIGKYFSALSNEANLKGEEYGWLVFGIEDKTHVIKGTNYKPSRAALDELKKLIADQTTNRITFEEIYDVKANGHRVILFQIPAAPMGIPIAYQGHYYGRDGESLVALNIREIEQMTKEERIQACYQHTCLLYEDRQPCNNQSIRERFGVGRQKMSMVSHVISDTVKAGLIAISKPDNSSKKYVAYVPFYV